MLYIPPVVILLFFKQQNLLYLKLYARCFFLYVIVLLFFSFFLMQFNNVFIESLSTNPVYSSSEEEVEGPWRKRRRRGRENTESSTVCEHSDSSESDGTDTNSISNLFAEDSSDEAFEGFSNRWLQWQEPVAEINPPPACEEPTGPKLPEEASAVDFFQLFFHMDFLESIVGETNRFAEQSQVKAG